MFQYLAIPLLLSQIAAGISPETLGDSLQVHRFGDFGMGAPEPKTFPVRRYLAVANTLQDFPERERVTWLRMAAASPHLAEPSIYLGRMLITNTGPPIRRIAAYVGKHAAGRPEKQFVDAPIEIFDGVPFLVATEMGGSGIPDSPADYMEHLLKHGKWRDIDFSRKTTEELNDVADRYIESLRDQGLTPSDDFVDEIFRQANEPLAPKMKAP